MAKYKPKSTGSIRRRRARIRSTEPGNHTLKPITERLPLRYHDQDESEFERSRARVPDGSVFLGAL